MFFLSDILAASAFAFTLILVFGPFLLLTAGLPAVTTLYGLKRHGRSWLGDNWRLPLGYHVCGLMSLYLMASDSDLSLVGVLACLALVPVGTMIGGMMLNTIDGRPADLPGHCRRCGKDLAFRVDQPCPKCGEPVSCRGCGYNLTGNASGLCPECGTPVRSVGAISHLPPPPQDQESRDV